MPSLADRILSALAPEYRAIRTELTVLSQQVQQMADNQAQFDERMAALDDATNEIAADLQSLRDQMASAGIPDSVLTSLDKRIARLQELGKDPENPVPVRAAMDADNIVWST